MTDSTAPNPIPVGQTFGCRTVLSRAPKPPYHKSIYVFAQCKCGRIDSVSLSCLRRGLNTSCPACKPPSVYKHGSEREHPEYNSWCHMRRRCSDPSCPEFHNYGGRGIAVCPEWNEFMVFLRDMGPRPSPHHSIDRFPDNDGPYCKGNCRWATKKEQALNKRTNRVIEFDGRRQTLKEWAQERCINPTTLARRLDSGWPIEKSLTARPGGLRIIEFQGERKGLAEWAREIGMTKSALRHRLNSGWTVDQAFTLPPSKGKKPPNL